MATERVWQKVSEIYQCTKNQTRQSISHTPPATYLYSRRSWLLQKAICFIRSPIRLPFHCGEYVKRCKNKGQMLSHCRLYLSESLPSNVDEFSLGSLICSIIARGKSRLIQRSVQRPKNSQKTISRKAAAPHSVSERNLKV